MVNFTNIVQCPSTFFVDMERSFRVDIINVGLTTVDIRFVVLVVRLHQQSLRIRLHHLIGFPPSGHRHFSLFQVLTAATTTTLTKKTELGCLPTLTDCRFLRSYFLIPKYGALLSLKQNGKNLFCFLTS